MAGNAKDIAVGMGVDTSPCLHLDGSAVDIAGATSLDQKVSFTVEGHVESVSQDKWSGTKKKHAAIRIDKIDGKSVSGTETDDEYDDED